MNKLHPLANGLAGYWPIIGPQGSITDESETNHTGALIGSPVWSDGYISLALKLNGSTQLIDVAGDTTEYSFIQNTLVFCVSAWIKIDNTTARGVIASTCVATAEKGFFFIFENAGAPYGTKALRFVAIRGVSGQFVIDVKSPDNVITDNNWHHVAVTGAGSSSITFYVDGIKQTTTTIAAFSTFSTGNATRLLNIGVGNAAPRVLYFTGSIYNVMIHNRTLHQGEIQELYYDPEVLLRPEPLFIPLRLLSVGFSIAGRAGPTLAQMGHAKSGAENFGGMLSSLGNTGHAKSSGGSLAGMLLSLGNIGHAKTAATALAGAISSRGQAAYAKDGLASLAGFLSAFGQNTAQISGTGFNISALSGVFGVTEYSKAVVTGVAGRALVRGVLSTAHGGATGIAGLLLSFGQQIPFFARSTDVAGRLAQYGGLSTAHGGAAGVTGQALVRGALSTAHGGATGVAGLIVPRGTLAVFREGMTGVAGLIVPRGTISASKLAATGINGQIIVLQHNTIGVVPKLGIIRCQGYIDNTPIYSFVEITAC